MFLSWLNALLPSGPKSPWFPIATQRPAPPPAPPAPPRAPRELPMWVTAFNSHPFAIAARLLIRHLPDTEFDELSRTGGFTFFGRSGRQYRIMVHPFWSFAARDHVGGWWSKCVFAMNNLDMPSPDHALAIYLRLRDDDRGELKKIGRW